MDHDPVDLHSCSEQRGSKQPSGRVLVAQNMYRQQQHSLDLGPRIPAESSVEIEARARVRRSWHDHDREMALESELGTSLI